MLIKPGVAMLELKRPDTGITINPTLLWDSDKACLIDTAIPGMLPHIRDAMVLHGVDISIVRTIIITHQDLDHTGCIGAITGGSREKINVMAHREEKPYIEGERYPLRLVKMEQNMDSLTVQMKALYDNLKANYPRYAAPVDTALSDGDGLDDFGGLEFIHTPGHMPGHLCVYLKRHKILVSGDALNVIDGRLSGPNPVFSMDMAAAARSLEKLTRYDIRAVICHHGGYYDDNVTSRLHELAFAQT